MTIPERIRPFADISHKDHENGKTVIVTTNGRGDTVSPGYQDDEYLKTKSELLEMLEESEDDVRSGRTSPLQESFDLIRKELNVNYNQTESG